MITDMSKADLVRLLENPALVEQDTVFDATTLKAMIHPQGWFNDTSNFPKVTGWQGADGNPAFRKPNFRIIK
jgi:hypothetical protein